MDEADPAPKLIVLLDELARVRGRLQVSFRPAREQSGLSEMQMVVLSAVVGAGRPPTVPQIGRSLGHPRQVIQRAALELAGLGLIELIDNPDHKRARLLEATMAGRALHAKASKRALQLARGLTSGLDPALIHRLTDGLRALRERLEQNVRATGAGESGDEAGE